MRSTILVCALVAVSLATSQFAEAQQPAKFPRVGVLDPGSASGALSPLSKGLRQGLRELGYIEGQNILIEYRYAEGKLDRLPTLAAELVSVKADVIVAQSPPAVAAAHRATKTIPIVMAGGGDPVEQGFVESLARPGGNLTGLSSMSLELGGKRLELFKEAVPRIHRLAVLWSSASGPAAVRTLKDVESTAPALGIQIQPVEVRDPDDFDNAFSAVMHFLL